MALFRAAQARKEPFDEAILYALAGGSGVAAFPVPTGAAESRSRATACWTTIELASRLSYFLWGSMPDKTLFELAAQGKLQDPEVLKAADDAYPDGGTQRRDEDKVRIVPDAKLTEFATRFVEQWLGTRELGRDIRPDPKLFPQYYDAEIQAAIRYEPILFFQEIMASNLSLLNLIDSKFTFLNSALNRHYGLDIPKAAPAADEAGSPGEQPSRRTAGHGCGRGRIVLSQSHQPGTPRQMGAGSAARHSASAAAAECAGA